MAGALGRLEDRVDRLRRRAEIGREAALVADAGGKTALVQHRLQRVEGLGADAKSLGEGRGAGRDEHELLQVDRVLRVRAAVDDVHHRDRQRPGVVSAEPAVERNAGLRRGGLRGRERDAEDRVRSEPSLVRRPVGLDHGVVERFLV